MGKTLYLECNAGISGDMTVAALLDLGADQKVLLHVLESIPADGFDIEIKRVKKVGIDCCDFDVILDDAHENHDHDMEYLHGHHAAEHEHSHHHEEEHHHEHEHDHTHSHSHRSMREVTEILNACDMTDNARAIAFKIFDILAKSESKAHNVPVEEVHFHEVGAIDSIVDIVAVAVCLDNLAIDQVIVPKLCEGTGTVRCQHGVLSVPVPAVANILEMFAINVKFMDIEGEFVTPTGAAIVAAVQTARELPKQFRIEKVGIGAGKRNYQHPSMVRAMIINDVSQNTDSIYKLESNIDDCTGEALGYAMERLFEAGARDVHYMPVFMKKNRPGWQLNVVCKEEDIEKLEEIIFRETTTIGIRRLKVERSVQERKIITVDTAYGEAKVKVCDALGQTRYYPEYESVAQICREKDKSFPDVYQMIVGECRRVDN